MTGLALTLIALACLMWVALGGCAALFAFTLLERERSENREMVRDLLQRIKAHEPEPRPVGAVPKRPSSPAILRERQVENGWSHEWVGAPQS